MHGLNRAAAAGLAALFLTSAAAVAAEPDSCKAVRFSDVGWTDITATTAIGPDGRTHAGLISIFLDVEQIAFAIAKQGRSISAPDTLID